MILYLESNMSLGILSSTFFKANSSITNEINKKPIANRFLTKKDDTCE